MTAIGYELLKTISVLTAGRAPASMPQDWVTPIELIAGELLPEPTDGIDVSDEINAIVGVRLNKETDEFRGWLKVHAASAGVPYGVEYWGGGVNAVAIQGASAAVIQTIIDNVLADYVANFGSWGTASQVTGYDVIEWVLAGNPDYRPPYNPKDLFRLAVAPIEDKIISNGAGMATVTHQSHITEAAFASWRVWGVLNGETEFRLLDLPVMTSYSPGSGVKVCCAAYERLYVEVIGCDGVCMPWVAPAGLDTEEESLVDASDEAWAAAYVTLLSFDNANTGRLGAGIATYTARGARAPALVNWKNTTVTAGTEHEIFPANPDRNGFFLQNQGANDVWFTWVDSRSTLSWEPVVGTAGFVLAPDAVRTGDNVPGNQLMAIADTASSIVYGEEW